LSKCAKVVSIALQVLINIFTGDRRSEWMILAGMTRCRSLPLFA